MPDRGLQAEVEQVCCALCGRPVAPGDLAWDEQSGLLLCPDCLAETESCGCED